MAIHERGYQMITVVAALVVPSYLTLALRCYVRITRRAFGKDDWCMLAAGAFLGWFTYEMIAGAITGIGSLDKHFATDPLKMIPALKHLFLNEISFAFAVVAIKLSITFMLLRVANNPIHLYIIKGVTAFYVLVSLIIVGYVLVECNPVQANWDPRITASGKGHCGPVEVVTELTYVLIVVNILADWFYVAMPAIIIWDLQINKRTKVATVGLLSLGIFTSVCSIVRLCYTPQFSKTDNHLYRSSMIIVWGYAETCVGMIAADCSLLRPLFRRVFKTEQSYPDGRTAGYPSNTGRSSRAPRLHIGPLDPLGSRKDNRNETNDNIPLYSIQHGKTPSAGHAHGDIEDDASDTTILVDQKQAQIRYYSQE